MTLAGKNALVTGGSRGIGFEICKALLENEANVLAVSRNPGSLARAHDALKGLHVLQADVSLSGDVDGVADWVKERWARLDILVNNAGVYSSGEGDLAVAPDSVFVDTIRINLLGPYYCTKRVLPFLLESDDPRVINVGSNMGTLSSSLYGAYSVSKAALNALTIATANELRGRVAVNVLNPGWVRTDMSPDAPGDPRTSAEAALWLLAQPRSITGKLFQDRREAGWSRP